MKKVLFMIFAAVMLTACESGYYGGEVSGDEPSPVETKKFTFTVKGDFKSPTFNKSKMRKAASALADDAQLTDFGCSTIKTVLPFRRCTSRLMILIGASLCLTLPTVTMMCASLHRVVLHQR